MSVPKRGVVLKVISPYKVVISLGRKQGVVKGMKFIIYEPGEMINDPQSGKPIEQLEIVKATVEITNVQEEISTAESLTVEKKFYPPRMGPYPPTMEVKERLPVGEIQEPKINPICARDLIRQLF